jgi:hypothetical protein
MLRRLNYTGRKKIPQAQVGITLRGKEQRTFTVAWKDLKLPESGVVYVEAYSSGSPTVMRFPWGTVGKPFPPSDPVLADVTGDTVSFDLKVVDESESVGRLLGICRGIRPRGPDAAPDETAGRQSLLPVNPIDLGDEVWRVTFMHDRPWLDVNNRIPGIMDIVRSDARFFALVFPAVIRRVLIHVVIVDEILTAEDDATDWQSLWLRWGIYWHPDNADPPDGEEDVVGRLSWIDDVAESFCKRHTVAAKLLEAMQPEGASR